MKKQPKFEKGDVIMAQFIVKYDNGTQATWDEFFLGVVLSIHEKGYTVQILETCDDETFNACDPHTYNDTSELFFMSDHKDCQLTLISKSDFK